MEGWSPQRELGRDTAVIIPVYFTASVRDEMIRQLLWMTLADLPDLVPARQIWLVVDGDARSAGIARITLSQLAASGARGIQLLDNAENRGKFGVMRQGMRAVLAAQPQVRYLTVMDGDADHQPAALPQLLRSSRSMAEAYGHERVIAIGARSSRARPMGWVRGELEALLDGLTADALAYALAREGRAFDTTQCLPGRVPDLSSGYKVYLREMASLLFDGPEPSTGCLSPWDYWHYGPETVTIVEAVLAGGVFGEVLRPSWDSQPATSFGEFSVVRMYGALLGWAWERLGIPLEVAATHYDVRRAGMALATAPEGESLLRALRADALARLAGAGDAAVPLPRATLRFI